ncbi:retron Ec67 family RNA-directed DNA polymerase/endonuclease [Massilia endophytica]|uniref:retron Ec67 family RNA-directed DNA polymerase/endonuclease n=1 Tax=Massilia endophytica TaxID=2899220 RepID=UPI001E5573CE|nr:retron Ec67 family RNA-directed DNA polymerase/endonuclease [Massilia endophytica]UGQ45825.1 retron Ec67 family RNA-directed DNA polymerase/endonuclease [Massilia endophytica]
MTQLAALKKASSLNDVADLLGYKPAALAYILYQISDENKYTSFSIPKRSGGVREIKAPIDKVKALQKKLANVLDHCLDELNAVHQYRYQSSHAFRKNKSIFTNASNHRAKRWVFNIDLENFFTAINFGRVRGYFIRDRQFELAPSIATILAQIACSGNSLPQGSPCSPVISNLIGHILDVHLAKLAARVGCRYTRYADDITFSTNDPQFPSAIAICDVEDSRVWHIGNELQCLIESSGFAVNIKKTRMQFKDSRQDVTGLIVNRKINVKKEYRRTVRAMVNRLLTVGHFERKRRVKNNAGEWVLADVAGTAEELHGMLGFIESVDKYNSSLPLKKGGKRKEGEKTGVDEKRLTASTGKDNLYRRFLLYKEFFAAPCPVILCEGETDNVYLIHAIRSRAADFPMLAKVSETNEITITPRLYKYVKTNSGRMLGLGSGGTGDLGKLIKNYLSELHRFVRPKQQHPFIILIDNDAGAIGGGRPLEVLRKKGVDIDRTAPYIFVMGNLYLVPTPLLGKEESMIEDLFGQNVLDESLDGKTFCRKNKADNGRHFGKTVFAHKIVRPNADHIDFSGFDPLLINITAVIEDFYKKHPRVA